MRLGTRLRPRTASKYLVGSINAIFRRLTIYGFNHWVVVQGYRLDPPEAGSPDLTVEGL